MNGRRPKAAQRKAAAKRALTKIAAVRPDLEILELTERTDEGLDSLCDMINEAAEQRDE